MPQIERLRAETMSHPGAKISGLRRPSSVGPVPPEQYSPSRSPFIEAPTARAFLAFSGERTHGELLAEKTTSESS